MLGSIQAVSFQVETVETETIVVGVFSKQQGASLMRLTETDRAAIEGRREKLGEDSEEAAALPQPVQVKLMQFKSREYVENAVRTRRIHIGVVFEPETLINDPQHQNNVTLMADLEDFRSRFAQQRLTYMIERIQERTNKRRKSDANLPPLFDQPFLIDTRDLSSPPSILGQVLPLILILMTITGAIYPAIDLTAGERERGTLESLMVTPFPRST